MDSSKQIKWGILLTYAQMFIGIAISIFYTSLTIRMLGSTEYGIYTLSSSIISYLNLFSLGFGATYIRFYSKYKAKNDEEGIKKLNGLFLIAFFILGALALIAGVGLIYKVDILFNATYSVADLKLARILMVFLTVNLTISFPMSVFVSYITSQEKFIFQKLVNMGKTILSPVISIFLLFLGYGSIGMVVATTIVSLSVDIINMIFCFTKLKFRAKFGKIETGLLKEILIFSLFIAINMLIDQLNAQTDKVILGKMINASAVAIYSVADQIRNMYVTLSTSVSGVFAPTVHRIVNSGSEDSSKQLTDLFIRIGRVQYFILMLVLTGFIFFGNKFISIWVGEEFSIAYWLVLILIIPGTIPLIQNIGIEIQRAKNKHQFRSLVYLIIAITNVIISIIFCRLWGIIGVTVGTAISNLLGQIIIMNFYYHKVIGLNIIAFWKSIFKASIGLIIPIVFGILTIYFANFDNVFLYFSFIFVYSILYLGSIYLIGMNSEEKLFVKKVFKNIISLIPRFCLRILKFFKKPLSSIVCKLKRMGQKLRKRKVILLCSISKTMDEHIVHFYRKIENKNFKVQLACFDLSGGKTSIDKIRSKDIKCLNCFKKLKTIKSKLCYVLSNPDLMVFADLYIPYKSLFISKKIMIQHGTATLTDGVSNRTYGTGKYAYDENGNIKFDKIFCYTKPAYDYILETQPDMNGVIEFVGIDLAETIVPRLTERDKYREQLGFKNSDKVVFMIGSWNSDSFFQSLGKEVIYKAKDIMNKLPNIKFILSIHPKEYTQYNEKIESMGAFIDSQATNGFVVRYPGDDITPFIAASDMVMGDFSSAMELAILAEKPIAYSNFDESKLLPCALSMVLKKDVPILYTADDVEKVIMQDYSNEIIEKIKLLKGSIYLGQDFYGQRINEIIDKLLK